MTTPEGTPPAGEGTPPAGTPPASDVSYFDSYDDETKGWLNNRGMDKLSATDALAASIKGHRNAEASLGVPADRRLDIPVDVNAEGAMDGIYNRLGRPDAAEGYAFTGADANDAKFDEWAREAFHKAGISQGNGDALYQSFKEMIGGTVEQSAADLAIKAQADGLDLQREWGVTHEKNVNLANATVASLGLSPEAFDAVKAAIGNNEAMKLFQSIGAGFGEDKFVTDNGLGPDGPSTPEGARSEIAELKKDEGFRALLRAGDTNAKKKWEALHIVGFGG